MKNFKFLIYALLFLSIGTAKAQYTDIFNFDGTNGQGPYSSVTLSGSTLYGITLYGGTNNQGVIFSMSTSGSGYTDLLNFDGTNGYVGLGGGLLILSGSTLYGITGWGGASSDGNIFSISTSGTGYTDLHDFNGTAGKNPISLVLSGSTLYGATYIGGANGYGCIFSMSTSGSGYTDLHDFDGTAGEEPHGNLTLMGSTLYGTTYSGGANSDGCIFSISTSGTGYTDLYDFNGTDGKSPYGALTLSGSTLYGTTYLGGANSDGCIFSISTSGTGYSDLFNFNGTKGSSPTGSLSVSGSTLYGTTSVGGANSDGVIFSFNTNGNVYTDLYNFAGGTNSGSSPGGNVTLSNGIVYGTAEGGGTSSDGVVFSLATCDLGVSTSAVNVTCNGGSNGSATATPAYGISPYTYSWSGGGTNATKTGLSAGTYTITVEDHSGCSVTATAIVAQPETLSAHLINPACNPVTGDGEVTAVGSGGTPPYTYRWEPGGYTGQTEAGPSGSYTCTVKDNCGDSVKVTATFDCPLVRKGSNYKGGIISNQLQDATTQLAEIAAYPNPNKGQFAISGLQNGMRIEMYDYTGRLISTTITANDGTMQFNLSNQTNGIYLIRITSPDGTLVKQTKVLKIE